VIDEPSHPRVRAARRCHSATGRAKTGWFLAEGPPSAREALATPGVVVEVFATPDWLRDNDRHADPVDLTGVRVHETSERVLARVAETASPQGVVALCRDVTVALPTLLATGPSLVVVLAEVRDPGNAGTIIRTADAAGAGGVVLTTASVDPLGGKCVRSSAGSLFHLPVTVGAPPSALDELRSAGLRVLAADGQSRLDLRQAESEGLLDGPTAWVVGNEAHGLPDSYRARCDAAVAVPIYGRAESLNVSVAAALCLYTSAWAQRPGRARAAGADQGAVPAP
jgi:TrmH family RNA methyltransferase